MYNMAEFDSKASFQTFEQSFQNVSNTIQKYQKS